MVGPKSPKGNKIAWERERYTWDASAGTVSAVTLKSNIWASGSGWNYTIMPNGTGSRVEVTAVRKGYGNSNGQARRRPALSLFGKRFDLLTSSTTAALAARSDQYNVHGGITDLADSSWNAPKTCDVRRNGSPRRAKCRPGSHVTSSFEGRTVRLDLSRQLLRPARTFPGQEDGLGSRGQTCFGPAELLRAHNRAGRDLTSTQPRVRR
jgi:hypothetical protein